MHNTRRHHCWPTGDIDYLRDVFGERAQIYRRGGHSGNMAYVDNVARMLAFLERPRQLLSIGRAAPSWA